MHWAKQQWKKCMCMKKYHGVKNGYNEHLLAYFVSCCMSLRWRLGSHWEIKYIARIYGIFQGTLVPWNSTLVFTKCCAYCQFLVFKWWLYGGKALGAVCLVRLYYMLHMFCVSTGSQPWFSRQQLSPRQLLTHSTSSRTGKRIGRTGVRKSVDWDIATCTNERKIHCLPAWAGKCSAILGKQGPSSGNDGKGQTLNIPPASLSLSQHLLVSMMPYGMGYPVDSWD